MPDLMDGAPTMYPDPDRTMRMNDEYSAYWKAGRNAVEKPLIEAIPTDAPSDDQDSWIWVFVYDDGVARLRDCYGYEEDGDTLRTQIVEHRTQIPDAIKQAVLAWDDVERIGKVLGDSTDGGRDA